MPVSEPIQKLLAVGLAGLVLVLTLSLVLQPAMAFAKRALANHTAMVARNARIDAAVARSRELDATQVRVQADQIARSLIQAQSSSQAHGQLQSMILNWVMQSQGQLDAMRLGDVTAVGGDLRKFAVSLDLRIPGDQLQAFLGRIAAQPVHIQTDRLVIERPETFGNAATQLQVNLVLSGYWRPSFEGHR